jgi:hypothetical protein
MVWHVWLVGLSSLLSAAPLGPPPSADKVKRFETTCREGIHVSCLRSGVAWLQTAQLTPPLKRRIQARLVDAYLALGRNQDADALLRTMIKEQPCSTTPPPLSQQSLVLYRQLQQNALRSDISPPIISHIKPGASAFRNTPTFRAKVTDDLHVKSVVLFYRTTPKGMFRRLPFSQTSKTQYSATIPKKTLLKIKEFQYYILATDCANQKATNQANAQSPMRIILEVDGSSAKSVGGGVLIAIGVALVVGSSLAFFNVSADTDRWNRTNDLKESENIRERIILFTALGWGGIGLGLLAGAGGAALLMPDSFWKQFQKQKQPPQPTTPPNTTTLLYTSAF